MEPLHEYWVQLLDELSSWAQVLTSMPVVHWLATVQLAQAMDSQVATGPLTSLQRTLLVQPSEATAKPAAKRTTRKETPFSRKGERTRSLGQLSFAKARARPANSSGRPSAPLRGGARLDKTSRLGRNFPKP